MVWRQTLEKVAEHLNISLTLLRRYLKRVAIAYPPKGYWTRINNGYSHEEALVSQKQIKNPKCIISKEQLESAINLIKDGKSVRYAAKTIGFNHSSLLRKIKKWSR